MAQVLKKQNLTIAIREYQDNQGQTKKVWKTIGEIITWDDGKQSFELWGAGGYVKGSVFEQDNNSGQAPQQPQQGGYQQAPQQQYAQQPQQNQQQPRPQGSGQNFQQPQ